MGTISDYWAKEDVVIGVAIERRVKMRPIDGSPNFMAGSCCGTKVEH